MIDISLLVLLKLWEKGGEASDCSGLALLRRMVTGRHPSESWTRCEKREQVWREFIGHLSNKMRLSFSKKRSGIDRIAMFAVVMIARNLAFTLPVTRELEGSLGLSRRIAARKRDNFLSHVARLRLSRN